jgi:hypothetical protein
MNRRAFLEQTIGAGAVVAAGPVILVPLLSPLMLAGSVRHPRRRSPDTLTVSRLVIEIVMEQTSYGVRLRQCQRFFQINLGRPWRNRLASPARPPWIHSHARSTTSQTVVNPEYVNGAILRAGWHSANAGFGAVTGADPDRTSRLELRSIRGS